MMETITQIILNQGVAIAMLVYFVLRFEKILNNNTEILTELVRHFDELKGGYGRNGRRK